MRLVLVVLISTAVCLSLCSCESTSNPADCSQRNAVTAVWAYHSDEPRTAPAFREGTTSLNGVVLADPLPTLQSVGISGEEFSDPSYFEYNEGHIFFGELAIHSGFDPIEVAVRTSAGDVEGAVSLPDEITHLEFSESETLEVGEALTVSWPGHEADFYYFQLEYLWGDSEVTGIDTIVSGSSMTIDGSFFSHDGVISDVWVQPSNGPMPGPGATGNMSGYGSGYLYYTRPKYSAEEDIQVGDGLGTNARSPRPHSPVVRRAMMQRTILRMLGLPVQPDR